MCTFCRSSESTEARLSNKIKILKKSTVNGEYHRSLNAITFDVATARERLSLKARQQPLHCLWKEVFREQTVGHCYFKKSSSEGHLNQVQCFPKPSSEVVSYCFTFHLLVGRFSFYSEFTFSFINCAPRSWTAGRFPALKVYYLKFIG